MNKWLVIIQLTLLTFIATLLCAANKVSATVSDPLILTDDTERINLYDYIDLIKIDDSPLTIDNVITSGDSQHLFKQSHSIQQKRGFFKRENWIRFTVTNESNERDWILEFAFPLINELDIYLENEDASVTQVYETGSDYPFKKRDFDHRNFIFNFAVEQETTRTFYIYAVGSGDLHPPIMLWDKDEFAIKTSKEFLMLGLFYGIALVMIVYNLFLYLSLKIRSYLYYVITIIFILLGKLSINGVAYQFFWPNSPQWNLHATPVWVSLGSIFILIFSRNFLDIKKSVPAFNKYFYILIILNSLTIVMLPISRYIALHMMVITALITFIVSLLVAIICLLRGVRQARFYLLSWIVFLTGVSITLLERSVIIPYTLFTEYAGQAALTIEVVLLSFALADKINIIRQEKEIAEQNYKESQKIALENLQKADKLKDDFLAITSHELRTPLYGIIGIAESLRDGITGPVSSDMKKQLSIIIKSGQRLTYLVDEILDFSRLKYESVELDLKRVNISNIIELVIAISKPMIRDKEIKIINRINEPLPTIIADENRLQQVFHNILDNAIKYTDEGNISFRARIKDDMITISISDTGRGIAEDKLATIFKPFQQGTESILRETTGVGIGLNVAKDLIELHDGKLELTSELNKGSTFSMTFPIDHRMPLEEKMAVTLEESVKDEDPDLIPIIHSHKKNKPNILVADDELVNLQVLTNQLSLEGYGVYTTLDGEDVFDILLEHDIDLLILDIMMPGRSGYDICKQLRKSYSLMDLPILMLTAKNQLQDKMIAFEAGANDYLVKPCDKKELLSRVKTLVEVKTLNEQLRQINLDLEDKVLERTKELKTANEELTIMADSRRQMLANIAHELGTPVTLVHNYLQAVNKGLIEADDEHYMTLVKDKVNILNRLVEDLFDLSMLEAGRLSFHMEEVNVYDWLTDIYNTYEFTTRENKRGFQKNPVDKALKNYIAYIDPERMDQLFLNLIDNAIKHTRDKDGIISVKSYLQDETHLLIEVSDNGEGIDEDSLELVFERFYKMQESNLNGTGLGLAIVKEIVLQHGGKIWAESKEGKGASFSIVIAVKREDSP